MKTQLTQIVVVFAILTAGVACKRKISVPGGSIEQNGDQVKIETADGGSFVAGDNVKLPEGYPDDLPQPSTNLEMAMKMPQGFNVAFVCKESAADLFTTLQEELSAKEWEQVTAMQQPKGSVLGYKKGDKRHVQCAIGKNSKGQTLVTVMATQH